MIISIFTAFAMAFVLSFIGSLLPGIINVSVALKTIRFSIKAGLILALGASIMEWIQSYVAIIFVDLLSISEVIDLYIQYIALFVFIALSIYYFFFAKTTLRKYESSENKKLSALLEGMGIAALNVMVFPYWVFYVSWLKRNAWLEDEIIITVAFCTGVAFGAFAVFWMYSRGAQRLIHQPSRFIRPANIVVATIFLILAIYQFISLH